MQYIGWALALLSGVADGASRGIIKLTSIRSFLLLAAGNFIALPIYIGLVLFTGIPVIHPLFWWALICAVPTNMLARMLTVEAHRSSPLMLTAPYTSLAPVFLIVSSPLLGGGTPTREGVWGVIILVMGVYLLNTRGFGEGIMTPFRRIRHDRGSRFMIAVSVIYGINSNFDKWGIDGSNTSLWLFSFNAAGGLGFLTLLVLYRLMGRITQEECRLTHSWRILTLYGLCGAAVIIPQMFALELIKVVPYVIALKRGGAILSSTGLGLALAFLFQTHRDEKEYWQYRLPGILLIVAGMIIIILS